MFLVRLEQGSFVWKYFKETNKLISSTEMTSVLNCGRISRKMLLEKKKDIDSKQKKEKTSSFEETFMYHGRIYEPVARKLIMENLPRWDLLLPGVIRDIDQPICCSPDGIIENDLNNSMKGLEIKCPFYSTNIPTKKEDIRIEYLIQCFTCLHVTQVDSWLLVFYDASNNQMNWYEMLPNEDLWRRVFLTAVDLFVKELEDNKSHLSPKIDRKEVKEKKAYIKGELLKVLKDYIPQ